jgi:hypothetical protein
VIFTVIALNFPLAECPGGWTRHAFSCYYLDTSIKHWFDAQVRLYNTVWILLTRLVVVVAATAAASTSAVV